MTNENAFSFFKILIWPSAKELIENIGFKVCTTRLYTDCLMSDDNPAKLMIDVGFSPECKTNERKEIILKQKLKGKLLNLFSEYNIVVNEITYNCHCFPDLCIEISAKELVERFENFTNVNLD